MEQDQQRDYAEESYNRDYCQACGASPCTWNGKPDGFHTDEPEQTEIIRKDVTRYGIDPAWLVVRNGQHFVISTAQMDEFEPETQAFRATPEGEIRSWDNVAGGRCQTKEQVLAELTQRPTDDDGWVMSARDVMEREETRTEIERTKAAADDLAEHDAKVPSGGPYQVPYYGISYHQALAIAHSRHPSRVLANTLGYRYGRFIEQDDGTVTVDMMGSRIAEFRPDEVLLHSQRHITVTTTEALSALVTGGYFYTEAGVIKFSAYETTGSHRTGHPFTDGQRFSYVPQALRDTETTCHCGAEYNGSDHCPSCGCEQYESLRCPGPDPAAKCCPACEGTE